MLIGFLERKDGLQHEFTRCGIHTGSTLLLELQPFSNKKKKERGWRKKNTSKYTSFHFISDELFFAWEMDERWLQEAARSDTFFQALLRGPKVTAMHLIFKCLPRFRNVIRLTFYSGCIAKSFNCYGARVCINMLLKWCRFLFILQLPPTQTIPRITVLLVSCWSVNVIFEKPTPFPFSALTNRKH